MASAKGDDGDAQGLNRFDDVFHQHGDDRDTKDDANTDITEVYAAVAREEEQEQQLSQKLSQLSASNEESTTTTTTTKKRSTLTPPATTTEVSIKRMRGEDSSEPIPNYLSSASKLFDQRMSPLLQTSAPLINIEYLRQMAHLMHKLIDAELDVSLWTAYLQSGTGEWKDATIVTHRPLLLWPHDVKTTMINKGHVPDTIDPKTIDHEECLAFVYQTLRQYRDQRDQYEQQLKAKKYQLNNSLTSEMEETMMQFVEQHGGVLMRVPVEGQIAIVKYDYADRQMELEYEVLTPYESQLKLFHELTKAKHARELTKYEVAIAKQRLKCNHLPKSFESVRVPAPMNLDTITDEHQRQRLKDRCEKIIQQAKSEMMTVHIAVAESKMNEARVTFDTGLAKMNELQSSGPHHMKLTSTMMAILKRRFDSIDKRMAHVYELKMRFFVTAPTATN
jgi:hypothetical protein